MKYLILLIALLATTAVAAQGNATSQHLLIGDTDVYYGLAAPATLGGRQPSHAGSTMHGAIPGSRHKYHLVVALFDHATHRRIDDARVTAAVQEIGMGETRRKLELMGKDDTVTYGAYFDMSGPGPYRVKLEVRRRDRPGIVSGQFEYRVR
ncbi:hypothetical protein [Trinickia sp. Y13]|jgi:hypothetical protein|uniref:hypothetical protein n=1 Tax=Trinickia sp. Y13 TaxID=2917807 RepID=UPI002406294C|nr:hypothetical protein [Trinickia sp. Y13]MDG0027302.1 hypothetical protein [Trinickia sp. Y13]